MSMKHEFSSSRCNKDNRLKSFFSLVVFFFFLASSLSSYAQNAKIRSCLKMD